MISIRILLQKLLDELSSPVVSEWPIFLIAFLGLTTRTISNVIKHSALVNEMSVFALSFSFLSIAFVYSYFLTLLSQKNKKAKILFYIAISLLALVILFLKFNFGAAICPETLLLLLESNSNEVSDFLSAFALSSSSLKAYLISILLVLIILVFERNRNNVGYYFQKYKSYIGILVTAFLITGFYSFSLYYNLFKCTSLDDLDRWNIGKDSSLDNITCLIHGFYSIHIMGNSLKTAELSTMKALDEDSYVCWNDDSLHVVFVIGESFIKRHSSLYGYELNTNPFLDIERNKGNLFVYYNAKTCFFRTTESVRNIFSCNSCEEKERWEEYPCFPAIFKRAGYTVSFWDNQYIPMSNQYCDFSLNSYLHSPIISQISYDVTHPAVSNYDGDLINSYKSFKRTHGNRYPALTIFHLIGQHFDAKNHYPKGHSPFGIENIKRTEDYITQDMKAEIAHYDNCTHYNDSVIYSILSSCREESAVVIYLSDHGETIYDIGPFRGRPWEINASDTELANYLYEVPFMVWCSDKYIVNHPDVVSTLHESLKKSFTIDVVCNMLMTVGGVKSRYYRESKDVLSSKYVF